MSVPASRWTSRGWPRCKEKEDEQRRETRANRIAPWAIILPLGQAAQSQRQALDAVAREMSWGPRKLKSTYRDQLIRELQHLATRTQISFSAEVAEVMLAINRDGARSRHRMRALARHRQHQHLPAAAMRPHNTAGHVRFWNLIWRKRVIRHDDLLEASELYLLEATLIEHLDSQDLKLRIAVFRDILSNLLTADSYLALSGQFCDLPTERDEEKLRGEARALASRLYRRYEGVPAVESLRRDIVTRMYVVTVLIGLAVLVITRLGVYDLAWAAVAGAIGASISTMSRLYDLDSRHEPFQTWLTIENGQLTLLLAPLVGATFALVLLAMFMGNIVTGILFPAFPSRMAAGPLAGLAPADFAKLMLWSFASGWAERMVPDVLDKLTPKTKGSLRSVADGTGRRSSADQGH